MLRFNKMRGDLIAYQLELVGAARGLGDILVLVAGDVISSSSDDE